MNKSKSGHDVITAQITKSITQETSRSLFSALLRYNQTRNYIDQNAKNKAHYIWQENHQVGRRIIFCETNGFKDSTQGKYLTESVLVFVQFTKTYEF